jgi:hypothetical protein
MFEVGKYEHGGATFGDSDPGPGITDSLDYSHAKNSFITMALAGAGLRPAIPLK